MDEKLKALAAKHFGLEAEAVTDAHVNVVKSIIAEGTPEAPPALDASAAELKELKGELLELKRKYAESLRPEVDPAEAERDAANLRNTKTLPDITTAVLDDEEQDPRVKSFRKQWDILHTLSTLGGGVGENGRKRPVQQLAYWKQLASRYPEFVDAINKSIDTATSGEGSQWAPTLYSTDMQESVYDQTTVAAQFPRIRSPKQSWVLPFSPTGGTVYAAGESTTVDPANFTETTPVSASQTITAKKLMCRVPWSDEFDEESIVAAAPMFQAHTARLLAEAIDSAIMNGDTTTTHMDTGKSFTSTSPESQFDGLRDIAKNGMKNSLDCSDFTGDKVLALIGAGTERFINDPRQIVIFTNIKIRGKWFNMIDNATNKNPVYMRGTPMGDALVNAGAIMDFYGSAVIPTAALWANMPNTGLYTTSGAYTAIVWCNKTAFWLTDRKEISSILVDQPLQGLKNVLTSWRGSFNAMHGTTNKYAGYGYGISVA